MPSIPKSTLPLPFVCENRYVTRLNVDSRVPIFAQNGRFVGIGIIREGRRNHVSNFFREELLDCVRMLFVLINNT